MTTTSLDAVPVPETIEEFIERYEPLLDRVLCIDATPEESRGGLVYAQGSHPEPGRVKVLKVGPGNWNSDGKRIPMGVGPGDIAYMRAIVDEASCEIWTFTVEDEYEGRELKKVFSVAEYLLVGKERPS